MGDYKTFPPADGTPTFLQQASLSYSQSRNYTILGRKKGKKEWRGREQIRHILRSKRWELSSLKLKTDTKPQIQEAQKTASKIKNKRNTYRSIIFKLQKSNDKKKILKEVRGGEWGSCRGIRVRITTNSLSETMRGKSGVKCLKCWYKQAKTLT